MVLAPVTILFEGYHQTISQWYMNNIFRFNHSGPKGYHQTKSQWSMKDNIKLNHIGPRRILSIESHWSMKDIFRMFYALQYNQNSKFCTNMPRIISFVTNHIVRFGREGSFKF